MAHGRIAALICAAALALRVLFPAGYMVSAEDSRLAVTLCSGMAAEASDMDHRTPEPSSGHGKAQVPCAFAGLSVPALGGSDIAAVVVIPPVAAIAALSPFTRTTLAAVLHLRPPLRGPPAGSRPTPADHRPHAYSGTAAAR
jgi:hypothetical protein